MKFLSFLVLSGMCLAVTLAAEEYDAVAVAEVEAPLSKIEEPAEIDEQDAKLRQKRHGSWYFGSRPNGYYGNNYGYGIGNGYGYGQAGYGYGHGGYGYGNNNYGYGQNGYGYGGNVGYGGYGGYGGYYGSRPSSYSYYSSYPSSAKYW